MSKEKYIMKIGKLKSILAKYDNEDFVTVWGGENENGSFGVLGVSKTEEDADEGICYDYIMEYEY